ncbi:uncharacterized protein LOC109851457 [Asparagus officinalis]|uniref:uncharacterized protein LOC109851457 n=1 Tax=Asparagus officinalis TaxID=4686 RepID=UPI00098DF2A8|nr:uncharacterized protein LOC109851457 [Asparagus officinalis]
MRMRKERRLFSPEGDRSWSITAGTDAGYSSHGPSDATPEPSPDVLLGPPTFPSYTFHTDLHPKMQDYLSFPFSPDSQKPKADSRKYHPRATRKLVEMIPMLETRKAVALAAKEREIANGAKSII